MHQHKARQSKGRGAQNLRENREKYWTLNVPIQHLPKKATGRKTRSGGNKTLHRIEKQPSKKSTKTGAGHNVSQRKASE